MYSVHSNHPESNLVDVLSTHCISSSHFRRNFAVNNFTINRNASG